LFERLMLEINQAGLSWILILKKSAAFHQAFDGFNPAVVAAYDERKIEQLLKNDGIIRNRMKIKAAIENAKRVLVIQKEHGSFKNWLDTNARTHKNLKDWTKLFKKTFFFMGPEIVNEFLMSTGYLPGAHSPECEAYKRIKDLSDF